MTTTQRRRLKRARRRILAAASTPARLAYLTHRDLTEAGIVRTRDNNRLGLRKRKQIAGLNTEVSISRLQSTVAAAQAQTLATPVADDAAWDALVKRYTIKQ